MRARIGTVSTLVAVALAAGLPWEARATDYVCAKWVTDGRAETATVSVDAGEGPPGHPYFNCTIASSSSSSSSGSSGPDYSRFWAWYEPLNAQALATEARYDALRDEALQLQKVGEASRALAWLPELAEDWERAAELAAKSVTLAEGAAAELEALHDEIPRQAGFVGIDAGKERASVARRLDTARYAARTMRDLAVAAAARSDSGSRTSKDPWGAEPPELVALADRIAAQAPTVPTEDVVLYATMIRRTRYVVMRAAADDLAVNPWVNVITANQLAQSDGLRDISLANRLLRRVEPELGTEAPQYLALLPSMTLKAGSFGRILPLTGEADGWRGTAVGVEVGTRRVVGTGAWTRDRWRFEQPSDVFLSDTRTGGEGPNENDIELDPGVDTTVRVADLQDLDVALPRLEAGVALDLVAAPLWWPVRPVLGPAVGAGLGLGRVKGTLDGSPYKAGTGGWSVSYGGRAGVDVRIANHLLALHANVHDARVFSYDGIWVDPAMNGWRVVVSAGIAQVTSEY